MLSAFTRIFTHKYNTSASHRHSAAIDAQLAIDRRAKRNIAHILVFGPAGSGKSALLRLLAPDENASNITKDSIPGDGGGVEGDYCSTLGSVTLTPSEDDISVQHDVEEKDEGKDDILNRRTTDPINEVLLEGPRTLRVLLTEVPSMLSRKVMHQFEGYPAAIVYPLDLSSYADRAPTTPSASSSPDPAPVPPNQLQASLDILDSLLCNPGFRPAVVIVLLTKADRLATKLQSTPFKNSFSSFEGDETVRGVAEHVLSRVRQLDARSLGRKLCVCPAVLNLAEEDSAKREAMRAGVFLFVTEMVIAASLVMVYCFGTSPLEEEELEVADFIVDKLAKGAWEGLVLKG